MSWDPNYGYSDQQHQGFYNPSAEAPSYYGNYGAGSNATMTYMTPTPVGNPTPYEPDADDEFANEPPLLEELGFNPEHILQVFVEYNNSPIF
jgi:hypothetical protein